jgi:hypothetical protein
MPYTVKGKCIYKKDGGAKVGCTKGDVNKYLAALHANVDESTENKLVGGKSDKLSIKDIAKKFDVSVSDIQAQIKKGIEVESEHTSDKEKATEIATDHVSEFPDYYDRLNKMEKKSEKELKTKQVTENTKSLIKRLIREELEEGKFGRMAGTLGMAAASLMPGNMNADSFEEPTEISNSVNVKKNSDGSFTSTAEAISPNIEFSKELALRKAKNQILEKLNIDYGDIIDVNIIDVKFYKQKKDRVLCIITITGRVK